MFHPLNVLVVDDNEADADLCMRELRRGGFSPAWRRVQTAREFSSALGSAVWDIVLSGYRLSHVSALEALDLLRGSDHVTPFVVITDAMDEATAVQCLKRGADNYLLKNNLSRLPEVVRHELREAAARREHYRAADTLRRTQERFLQLTESIREVFWITDRHKTEVVYVSPAYEHVFGRTCRSLYEDPGSFDRAIHKRDGQRWARFVELQKEGKSGRLEHRITLPDGSVRWIRTRAFPVLNERGAVYRIAGVSEDVTSRRRAELALQTSEKRYRTLVEHSGVGIWHVTTEGRTIYANPAMCAMLEIDHAQDLAGAAYRAFFAPGSLDAVEAMIGGEAADGRHADGAGAAAETEVQIVGLRGGHRWVVMTGAPMRAADGSVQSVLVSFVDVTGRKLAEAKLRTTDELNRRIIEAVPGGIVLIDADGSILHANAEAQRFMGMELDATSSRSFTDFAGELFDEDGSPVHAAEHPVVRCLTTGQPQAPVTLGLTRRDGRAAWAVFTAVPRLDPETGRPAGAVVTFLDITERMRAEDEKARLEADLSHAQKMEAIGTLASGVAHNFNNLLTAIFGGLTLALERLPQSHPAREQLNMIERAAKQGGELTRSLLTFAHKTESTKAPVELGHLVADSMTLLRHVLPASIRIHEDVKADGPVWVYGDAGQLQQVLMNLTVNARDAMPQGGRLSITLRRQHGPGDEATDPGSAVLVVRDSGMGMSAEVRARVFEPFFTTKARGRGTGLGLAAVHGIMADHRGWVEVESRPGDGTAFYITFPCCDAPKVVASDDDRRDAPAPHRGGLVLLAEQHDYVRSIMASTLQSAGYEVIQSADGKQVLDAFDERTGDVLLVLLGLTLAHRSAQECVDRMRARRPGLPVIVITGSGEEAPIRNGNAPIDLLRKPFQMADLTTAVQRAVERYAADGNQRPDQPVAQ